MERKHSFDVLSAAVCFALALGVFGLALGPKEAVLGLLAIMTSQDLLITDYIKIAGLGAALVNVSLLLMFTAVLLHLTGEKCHGMTFAELGLMAGFAFFGKNLANIWPFLLGTWIFCRVRGVPFRRYEGIALLSTALSPLVSWMMFGSVYASVPLGALVGVMIGYFMPDLSAYTYRVLNGLSLYNAGFACGLVAMMTVPILAALGDKPNTVLHWSSAYSTQLGVAVTLFSLALIAVGLFQGESPRKVADGWTRLLRQSGRAPCDWLRDFGLGPVLVNTGVNGLLGVGYILTVDGQFSGPVVGGIFALMGFGAAGKHIRNCLPVMAGVALGGMFLHNSPGLPALQIAGLFGTTLAPVAGMFGVAPGILAGALHSAVVIQTSGPVAGMNLYNNGFSGGLIALVLYPLLTAMRKRRPRLQDVEYVDALEGEAPPAEEEEPKSGD